jgi:anti-sigma B factor antagonist
MRKHTIAKRKIMSLAIETTDRKDASAVITLKGSLILGPDCARLNHLIHSLIDAGRRYLVFDLTGVVQLDSTGIGQFIDAYTSLDKSGGKMTISGATGPVQDAFRVTRLDTVFQFTPSVEAAFEAKKASEG